MAPILPELNIKWHDLFGDTPTSGPRRALPTRIAPFKHLMQRVDAKMLDALFESPEEPAATPVEAIADTIDIRISPKVDLRICQDRAVRASTGLTSC